MSDGDEDGAYAASFTSENSSALVEALRMAGLYDGTPKRSGAGGGGGGGGEGDTMMGP